MRNKRLIIIFSCLLTVTILVLLSSVIFTVKTVTTHCWNHTFTDPALDQSIIDNLGLQKGKSIFFIDENRLVSNLENTISDIDVINIQRKFPDRMTVHYVKLFDYYEVALGGYYYSLTHDGKVIDKREAAKSPDQKIRIVYNSAKSNVNSFESGDYIYDGLKRQLVSQIVSAFERLDLKNDRATARFDFIDIEYKTNCIYIGLTGIKNLIKIEDASDIPNLFQKIQYGYSAVIAPEFDRSHHPDDKNRYRMAYVINYETVHNPYSDYYVQYV